MTITMPEGTHLAYSVFHETQWWRSLKQTHPESLPGDGHPTINIAASVQGQGGGVKWEFGITNRELGRGYQSLQLHIFNEGWEAFALMAPFFSALASGEVETLDDVRSLLDSLGAADETER